MKKIIVGVFALALVFAVTQVARLHAPHFRPAGSWIVPGLNPSIENGG